MAAVQTHFAVLESREFVRKLRALAAATPDIAIYFAEKLPGPGL